MLLILYFKLVGYVKIEVTISSEENVISICCENHCYKDINENNVNSCIISSLIYLKNKKKRTCRDDVFKFIGDNHLVKIF